jgi:glycosyltransferase involved in cell wall biosynthesis
MNAGPSVSVVIPTFNEERFLRATLESVRAQTYPHIVEILVADGRSTDSTRPVARSFPGVRVVDNPVRIQSAGLNHALAECRGEIVVRVDGHCLLATDYVERCVDALRQTGAAMVGGAMSPVGRGARQGGIAAAMRSRLGAGPARFHLGGPPGWVDTVYLGAYRLDDARAIGGYAEDVGVNEDAEFAIRMSYRGGIWFDPAIESSYSPRDSHRALIRQFFRYGRSRATTARRHPTSIKLRQLAAPALVLAAVSPKRRPLLGAYAALVAARAGLELRRSPASAASFGLALPLMHLAWGTGFLVGLLLPQHAPAAAVDVPQE